MDRFSKLFVTSLKIALSLIRNLKVIYVNQLYDYYYREDDDSEMKKKNNKNHAKVLNKV